jgi:hypothetical protein
MAGTVARYQLDSTAEHLIAPLYKAGWKVDDFYSLYDGNLGDNDTWHRQAAKFEPEPSLSEVKRQDLDATIAKKNSRHLVQRLAVRRRLTTTTPARTICHSSVEAVWLPHWRGLERGSIAHRDFVHMCKEINMLWQQVETHEKEKGAGFQYSYVMFIRDDAYWFKDFDLDLMLQITGGRRHSADGRGQMFSTAMPPL